MTEQADRTEWYREVTQLCKERFDRLYPKLSGQGTPYIRVFAGAINKSEKGESVLYPAMANQTPFMQGLQDEGGVGYITLNVSPRACGALQWSDEFEAFIVNLSFGGQRLVCHVPPILIDCMFIRERPNEEYPISGVPPRAFFKLNDEGELVRDCPFTKASQHVVREPDLSDADTTNVLAFPGTSRLQ